jgi:DNA-directed RNA polymerase specialized sigma24 family protein
VIESTGSDTALSVLRMVIADLIKGLSPVKGEMVRLRIDGHEVDEIARCTQRSKRTVERTLQDFRQQLGRILEEEQSS